MNARLRRPLALAILLSVPAFLPVPRATACSTPVFRYALERWPSDLYACEIPPPDSLSGDALAASKAMRAAAADPATPANIEILWPEVKNWTAGSNPPAFMTLSYPLRSQEGRPAWKVPLTSDEVAKALRSPARSEVARRIIAGDSAVWVLLESGDVAKDDAAFATLSTNLAILQSELKLPDQSDAFGAGSSDDRGLPGTAAGYSTAEADGQAGAETSGIRIAFSVLRVSRDDPAEKFFVWNLLNVDMPLAGSRETIAFPVYGRGRALYALAGAGINADNIRESCVFLTGSCSCQAEELNPGVDLLMSAAWQQALADATYAQPPMPQLTGVLPVPQPQAAATQATAVAAAAGEHGRSGTPRLSTGVLVVLALIVGVVAVASVALRRRSGEQ